MKIYMATTGAAGNSGCTDQDAANLSGAAATVAGSVVSLDGSPDLSGLITAAGDTQSTIALDDANNTNRRIFKITAFDNTAKTVTVDTAPTGITSSAWAIGGRITRAGYSGQELSLQGGDELVVNDDQSAAGVLWSPRGSGTTDGYIRHTGAAGAYRELENTTAGSASVLTESGTTSGHWYENFLFSMPNATSGTALSMEQASVAYNCRFVGPGSAATGISFSAGGHKVVGCELTGFATAISMSTFGGEISANYIHHNTVGILMTGSSPGLIQNNVVVKNTSHGISLSGSLSTFNNSLGFITNNTIAWNGGDGLRVADADSPYGIKNNIFAFNGTTSGFNLNLTPGGDLARQAFMSHNLFYATGGGSNVNGYTLRATDINADPLFTNADASNDDYTLKSNSPAKGAGRSVYGFTSYMDLGAIQRREEDAVFGMFGGGGIVQR